MRGASGAFTCNSSQRMTASHPQTDDAAESGDPVGGMDNENPEFNPRAKRLPYPISHTLHWSPTPQEADESAGMLVNQTTYTVRLR
jgi:hypothetical protein